MTTKQRWEGWAYKAREMPLLPAKSGARRGREDPPPEYFGGITALWPAQFQMSSIQTEKEKIMSVLSLPDHSPLPDLVAL